MKLRVRLTSLFLVAVILCALPVDALGAVKQKSVSVNTKLVTIDLAKGSTYQLSGTVLPSGASQKIVWKSGKTSIARVSSSGLVTAKKTGTVKIGARPSSKKKWTKVVVKVIDSSAPTSISMNVSSLNLSIGSTYQLTATAKPSTASQSFKWSSSKSSVASVSSSGLVTAKKSGTTLIRAKSTRNSKTKTIKVTVKKLAAPSKITITPTTNTMEKGDTLQLTANITPSTANPAVKWASNNTSIATVSSSGLVTAKAAGRVQIKATSTSSSKVNIIRTIDVKDSTAVTSVEIDTENSVLRAGETLKLSAAIEPSTASKSVSWSSNNTSVATISSSGVITGKAAGSATISVKAGTKTDTIRIVVLSATPVDDEPSQTSSVSGISANLAKIDKVMLYTTTELDALYVSGQITKSECNARKTIIANAFRMARFPWVSNKNVTYWSGSKQYQANTVYFGIPYTQTYRTYNVAKLVSAGAFKLASGNSYYNATLPNKTYPGNDCSSFVSMSQWGTGTSYSQLNSTAMYKSTAYKTIATKSNSAGYMKLRPGDIFVRNGHVVMFLYYISSTRIMIIQQGGLDSLNTVLCSIKNLSYYSADSRYIARRKNSFA